MLAPALTALHKAHPRSTLQRFTHLLLSNTVFSRQLLDDVLKPDQPGNLQKGCLRLAIRRYAISIA
jgi:hypothetical protein